MMTSIENKLKREKKNIKNWGGFALCDSVVMKNIHDGLSSHILNTVGDFWEQTGALMN